jgi:hypothetical protein
MRSMSPDETGLPPVELDIEEVEPAHAFANDARAELRTFGFSDDAIDGWAREYVAHGGSGDVAELLAWIRAQEQSTNGGRRSAALQGDDHVE